jgi:hypothetical protein
MAKKTAPAKKAPANKACGRGSCGCADQPKKPAKKDAGKDLIEIGPAEEKALNLVDRSAKVRDALEQEATAAISKTVRKVFKDHGVALTAAEAATVAVVLFSE